MVEERTKKLNDFRAPEHRNQEGIMGYKKIKIHETRSHALNPAKGGRVITSQVNIKALAFILTFFFSIGCDKRPKSSIKGV